MVTVENGIQSSVKRARYGRYKIMMMKKNIKQLLYCH